MAESVEDRERPREGIISEGLIPPSKRSGDILNAWKITIFMAIVAFLAALSSTTYRQIFKVVIKGLPLTFAVTFSAILISVFIGLFVGLGQISSRKVLRMLTGIYVELIRGIPLLVQIMFMYFALGRIFQLQGLPAAIIALSICYGAYMSEIFRAGIQSIPRGQMEAAQALGMTHSQAMWYIILPQSMKFILPAIGNELIAMLKDSSLVSVVALRDILRRGREYVARTFLSLETYAMVALVYLIITLALSKLVAMVEDKMRQHEK